MDEIFEEDSHDYDYKTPVSNKTIREKQQAISDLIEENPDKTDYWIAKELGVSHNTVAAQRKRMLRMRRIGLIQIDEAGGVRPSPQHKIIRCIKIGNKRVSRERNA